VDSRGSLLQHIVQGLQISFVLSSEYRYWKKSKDQIMLSYHLMHTSTLKTHFSLITAGKETSVSYNLTLIIQCVSLATEPGISLIILTPMRILQEYVRCVRNEKECVCSVCLWSASNFVAISSLVVKLLKKCRVR